MSMFRAKSLESTTPQAFDRCFIGPMVSLLSFDKYPNFAGITAMCNDVFPMTTIISLVLKVQNETHLMIGKSGAI